MTNSRSKFLAAGAIRRTACHAANRTCVSKYVETIASDTSEHPSQGRVNWFSNWMFEVCEIARTRTRKAEIMTGWMGYSDGVRIGSYSSFRLLELCAGREAWFFTYPQLSDEGGFAACTVYVRSCCTVNGGLGGRVICGGGGGTEVDEGSVVV